jgi:hypothetical protein
MLALFKDDSKQQQNNPQHNIIQGFISFLLFSLSPFPLSFVVVWDLNSGHLGGLKLEPHPLPSPFCFFFFF